MASGTINLLSEGANGSGTYIVGKIEWKSTPVAEKNHSTLWVELSVRKDNYTTLLNQATEGTWSYELNINGTKHNGSQYKSVLGWTHVIEHNNLIVPHNSDGSKSINISGTITGPSGTSLAGIKASGNKTVTLDTIPRATKIDSVTCNTPYVDGIITAKYTPKANTFYHKRIVYVNVDGTLTHIHTKELGKAATTQQTHTLQFDNNELSLIYSKVTKTPTATIRVTLQTYSDSNYSNKVGGDQFKEIKLNLPNSISPTVELELTAVNNTYSWLGSNYVAGLSGIKATMTATEADKYAKIVSTAIGYNGVTYNGGDATTFTVNIPPLSKPGEIYLTATAMDSRNRFIAATRKITVLPYSAPVITSVKIERGTYDNGWTADDNGGALEVRISTTLALADVGNTYDVTFKVDGSTKSPSYGETHQLISGADCVVYFTGIDGDASHTLTVTATDRTNNKGTVKLTIPTRHITMEFNKSGKGIAFGKTSEEDAFECAWDADFKKNVNIDGTLTINNTEPDMIVEQGTSAINHTVDGVTARSGTWSYRKWSSGIMECWGIGNVNVKVNMTWSGTGLYYGVVSTINFPFAFTEIPVCTVDVAYGDDDKSLVVASCGRGTNVYARPIMLCRNTSGTFNCDLHYHAIGRWK